jgi:anti-anti-sigma factor
MYAVSVATFHVDQTRRGTTAVLALYGELDLTGCAELRAQIERALATGPDILALDLRGLTFMDTNAISLMVMTAQRCLATGRRLSLVRGGPQIDRLLMTAGLDRYVYMVSDPAHLPVRPPRLAA